MILALMAAPELSACARVFGLRHEDTPRLILACQALKRQRANERVVSCIWPVDAGFQPAT